MITHTTPRDLFEPVLTLAELAGYLNASVQTLYDLRTRGRGPRGFRVGRCLHFRKSEVDAWLDALQDEDAGQLSVRTRP